jgi:hypothetical protein
MSKSRERSYTFDAGYVKAKRILKNRFVGIG